MLTIIALLLSLLPGVVYAAGSIPAVNSDIGCADAGDAVSYNGSALACGAGTRPTKTVGALPTCNSGARGKMYIVTDALLPAALATIAAGGAVVVGVTCNGTVWIVQ